MKLKQIILSSFSAVLVVSGVGFSQPVVAAENEVIDMVFPILGGANYENDYDYPRSGGRTHQATDLFEDKMAIVLAAVDGRVTFLPNPEPIYGWTITITDENGYQYNYLHMNNDSPGTDDGNGGFNNAFAAGIQKGSRVVAGQHIGFLGDSGNAESTPPHIHFEIEDPDGNRINPYFSLEAAEVLYAPVENNDPDANPTKEELEEIEKEEQEDLAPKVIAPTESSFDIFPYDEFEGGANVVTGDVTGDGQHEIITGTAFGGGGRTIIKVYDQDETLLYEWFAYGNVFRGGVDVATADFDGDGAEEIVTAAGPGGGPHVKVFNADGSLVTEFMAYGAGFRGGVYVSAADVDSDGNVEIVTGPGAGGGPHIRVFSASGTLKNEWFAYDGGFTGGVDVAAVRRIAHVPGGVITGPGPTGGPHVKVFNLSGVLQEEFMAYEPDYVGGLRLDADNVYSNNGAMEVVLMPARNSRPNLKVFALDGRLLKNLITGFDDQIAGGYDVAVTGQSVYISNTGGRQTQVVQASGL